MNNSYLFENDGLDMLIPVSAELDSPTVESTVRDILEQHGRFGFTRFALACPSGGWRSVGYPPREHFRDRARFFAEVREKLAPYGIACGWWDTLTIKSGKSDDFIRMVEIDGNETPFSSCPLDPGFRKRFSEDMALFAEIAKPAFIILEDDYSIQASSTGGCFCKYHLAEFSRRTGKTFTREELRDALRADNASRDLLFKWRELMRDSLVGLSEEIRKAVDIKNPEIPIGMSQSGNANLDGDFTEAVARALAGKNHTPFSRIFGASYCGIESKDIPLTVFNPLYHRQHIKEPFVFYHETDCFPHTRFFAAANQVKLTMAAVYSYGYEGSLFQTQQLVDDPNEELIYADMFSRERERFSAVSRVARKCRVKGVGLAFDPFYNTSDGTKSICEPLWTRPLAHFGIPATTLDSPAVFLDERDVKYADCGTLLKLLSKTVFLDGDAAKRLCSRGFAQYLGVTVGDDVGTPPYRYDLGAREITDPPFDKFSRGKNMPSAHMYAVGRNGKLLKLTVTDEKCETVSHAEAFDGRYVCPAMTRFENKLGGNVTVMGLTLDRNASQSLYNYRRQRLITELLIKSCDEFVITRSDPSVFTVMNEPKDENGDFIGMLSLINLCEDTTGEISFHLPPRWKRFREILSVNEKGEWVPIPFAVTADGVQLAARVSHSEPLYLLFR